MVLDDVMLPVSLINSLPLGFRVVNSCWMRDPLSNDEILYEAVMIGWYDKEFRETRYAWFSMGGDYWGDSHIPLETVHEFPDRSVSRGKNM